MNSGIAMTREDMKLGCRRALPFYTLKRLGLIEGHEAAPEVQQIAPLAPLNRVQVAAFLPKPGAHLCDKRSGVLASSTASRPWNPSLWTSRRQRSETSVSVREAGGGYTPHEQTRDYSLSAHRRNALARLQGDGVE